MIETSDLLIWLKNREDIFINYYMRQCPQPKPKHNDPADYGIVAESAWKMRLRYLNQRRKEIMDKIDEINGKILKADASERRILTAGWKVIDDELEGINKNIFYIKKLINHEDIGRSYDIKALREIPIDKIVEVNRAGFFAIREERTPSCKWYRETNTWHDFGSDEHGDNIDLIQKLNNCGFLDACAILSNYN